MGHRYLNGMWKQGEDQRFVNRFGQPIQKVSPVFTSTLIVAAALATELGDAR